MKAENARAISKYLSQHLGDKFVILFDDYDDIGMISGYELDELTDVLGSVLDTLERGELTRQDINLLDDKGKVRKLDC